MVVVYTLGMFVYLKSVNGSRVALLCDHRIMDANESVWIVPGTFDTLYN